MFIPFFLITLYRRYMRTFGWVFSKFLEIHRFMGLSLTSTFFFAKLTS